MKARDIGQRLAPGKAKGQNGAGRAENTSNNKGWRAGEPMTSPADAILAKAAWRLIPVMALMYVVSFLDRVNIGFAALTMNRDLGFTPEVYGFGAGIFFFGYFI